MRAWLLCALITTLWRIHGLCRWKGRTKLLQHEYELSLFTPISRETTHPRETCKSVTCVGITWPHICAREIAFAFAKKLVRLVKLFCKKCRSKHLFFFSIVDIKLRILRKHDIPGPRYEDTRSPWDSNAGNYTEHEATEKFIRVFLFRKIFVIKTNCIRSSFEGHQCLVFPCRMIRNIHETTKRFATRTSAARGRYEFYCIFWVQGWKGYGTREFSWAWMVPAQHEIWAPAFLTH